MCAVSEPLTLVPLHLSAAVVLHMYVCMYACMRVCMEVCE